MLRQSKRIAVLKKELASIDKKEEKLRLAAMNAKPAAWRSELESKLPDKVYTGIESAFCKAFALLFEQGRAIIEKSYDKEALSADHSIRDFAINVKGGRREIRGMSKQAGKSNLLNLTVTTVEGLALGALGIGLPDIALFLSTVLKDVYETALNYGYGYESREERYLILKMLAASLKSSGDWAYSDMEIDRLFKEGVGDVTEEALQAQIKATAATFALDMLALKFIQGIPIIGFFAGAANPFYYRKISTYVHLKYKKHYYLRKLYEAENMLYLP